MRIPICLAAACVLLTVAATACSSGSKPAGSGPAGGTPVAGASNTETPGAGTVASGGGKSPDVCAILPAAKASKIIGKKLKGAKANNTSGLIFGCNYGEDGGELQISVQTQAGKIGYTSAIGPLKAVGHPPVSISGVGDEAFSEPNPNGNAGSVGASAFASYGAVFGDTYIQIGGLDYVNAAQGKHIVELIHSKL
jgi:hypothetical protein